MNRKSYGPAAATASPPPSPPMKLPSMSDVIDCANVCQSLNKPTPL
jgi:hypothetical protein